MKNFLSRHRTKLIPAAIAVGVIIFSLSSFLAPTSTPPTSTITPTPTSTTTKISSTISSFTTLPISKFILAPSFTLPTLPVSFSVFSARLEKQDHRALAAKLATFFKLQPVPQKTLSWSTKNLSSTLRFVASTSTYVYLVNSELTPLAYTGKKPPTLAQCLKNAKSFISQFPELADLSIPENAISYFTTKNGGMEFQLTTSKTATLIQIPLTSVNLDYPVKIESSDQPYLTLLFGQNSNLVRLDLSQNKLVVDPAPQYRPSLSAQTITDRILSDQATLVGTDVANTLLKNQSISSTLTSASIEYRFNQNLLTISPYLRLSGELMYSSLKQPSPATFILPLTDK
jgi:hypothetical protein